LNIFVTDAATVGSGQLTEVAWPDIYDYTQGRSRMDVMCVVHAILIQQLWRAIKETTQQKNLTTVWTVTCTSSLLTIWVDTGRIYTQRSYHKSMVIYVVTDFLRMVCWSKCVVGGHYFIWWILFVTSLWYSV